jgi:ABC-type multidrug transport system fused ATPase/permease subunit
MPVQKVQQFKNSVVGRSVKTLTKSDQKKIVFVIVTQVFLSLLDLAGIALFGILGALAVNGVQAKSPGNRVSAVLEALHLENLGLREQAIVIGVSAALFLICKTVISVFFVRKTIFFLGRRSAGLSAQLIAKVLAQPLVKIQSRSTQETLYTVTSGIESITLGIINTLVLLITDFSLLIILGIGLFVVDPTLAILTFLSFSSIGLILFGLLHVRAVKLGEIQRDLSIQSDERILEVLNSYREIVVRDRRDFYVKKLGQLRFDLSNVNAERMFMPNISKYVIELSIVMAALLIAGFQLANHDASHAIAVLSVFMAASTRIAPAILRIQQGALSIKSNIGSATPTLDMIESLTTLQPVVQNATVLGQDLAMFRPELNLSHVTFCYPGNDKPAIEDVTLNVLPGQVVSIVGASGAGKSTLADLVLGILMPNSGQILLSGLDPGFSIKEWPGAVGYVPQDVMISNNTIRQNIALGFSDEEISEDLIWNALQIAKLDDFVQKLPKGLETRIGDGGAKLSGGQRQRLGIARAMYTQPTLLLLDEATSALDGATEAAISEAIHELKGNVTVIIVAHRLSTVKRSDVVYFLSEGKLLASGSFDEVRASVPAFDHQASIMGL